MKKGILYNKLYRTKDQFVASTLYALGEKLDSTESENGVVFFVFENGKRCEELVKKYYANDLKVNPRALFDSFRTIKSILFGS